MQRNWLSAILGVFLVLGVLPFLDGAPMPEKKGSEKEKGPKGAKTKAFKPVEIDNALDKNDPNDPKLNNPAKQYTITLKKDKTYIIDLTSNDFDSYLRLLDKNGKQLAEDDDGAGVGNDARIIYAPKENGEHQIVVTSLDGEVGKFNLKVREFNLKGEAKARDLGKDGLAINDQIGANDKSDIGKLGKVYSVQLKAGQTYTIDLSSQDFDSYLYLLDTKSLMLAQDDDGGDGLNSRISFRPERDGVYHILATTLDGEETGEFSLKVSKE